MKLDGIALAISSTALRENTLPSTPLIEMVLRNFNPERSGDIFVVFEPHSFLDEAEGLPALVHHGSPWRYDTYVPIVFAGGSLTARRIYREIQTVDVAPTLAAIVGVKPPSGARGVPLVEVLQSQTGSTTVNP
jgi:arylsulfatase A-like enzyme